MAYSDHVRSSSRPSCWGEDRNYDPSDVECAECRWRTSCGASCGHNEYSGRSEYNGHSGRSGRSGYKAPYRPEKSDMGEAGVHQPGVVGPDEKPAARFAKDAVGGGLRGMFYEMWQFWRHYRIR